MGASSRCLAMVAGSFPIKFASVFAAISIADTFFIALALMFGPAPATIAVAVDSFVISWRRKQPWKRIAFNTAAPAVSMWAGAQAFFLIARVPPLAHNDVLVGPLILPLLALTVIYFALNSGLIAIGDRPRIAPVSDRDLAAPFPVAVDRLSGVGVAGVLPHSADPAGQLHGGGRDPAAAGGLPPDAAGVVRARGGRPPAPRAMWIGSTCPRSRRSRWRSTRKTT